MAATFLTLGRGVPLGFFSFGLVALAALLRAGPTRALLLVGVASGNQGIQSSRFGEVVGRGRVLGLLVAELAGFPFRTVINR